MSQMEERHVRALELIAQSSQELNKTVSKINDVMVEMLKLLDAIADTSWIPPWKVELHDPVDIIDENEEHHGAAGHVRQINDEVDDYLIEIDGTNSMVNYARKQFRVLGEKRGNGS